MPWGIKPKVAKKSTPTSKWGKPKPVTHVFKNISHVSENTWDSFCPCEQAFSQVSIYRLSSSFIH